MLNEILDKVCKEANESLFGNNYNIKNKVNEFSYRIISDNVEGKIVKVWNNITIGKSENEILGDILYFISQIFMVDKNLNQKQDNEIINDNSNIEINDNEINTTSNSENTF
jgi:protein-arginine kinase